MPCHSHLYLLSLFKTEGWSSGGQVQGDHSSDQEGDFRGGGACQGPLEEAQEGGLSSVKGNHSHLG